MPAAIQIRVFGTIRYLERIEENLCCTVISLPSFRYCHPINFSEKTSQRSNENEVNGFPEKLRWVDC